MTELHAALYIRVSTEDQARHGFSLPEQIDRCTARARELGATQITRFVDDGVSGELWERPGLSNLLAGVRQGRFHVFVCIDPDRLARKLVLQLLATDELEKFGVRIEFVDFEWQCSPEGKLFAHMRGAFAEYEKEKIRSRTTRGRARKAREGGLPHYACPYGYRWHDGGLVVDEHEAPAVRDAFRWFVAEPDLGYRMLARKMQENHPSRSGTWDPSTLRRLLLNPAYMGLLYVEHYDSRGAHLNKFRAESERVPYRRAKPLDQAIAVPVPAIIDGDLWTCAREKAAVIHRNRGVHQEPFLLSRLVRCGACGSTMPAKTQHTAGRTYRYYRCLGHEQGRCNARQVRADEVERIVWSRVLGWIRDPDALSRDLRGAFPEATRREREDEARQIDAFLLAIDREEERVWTAWRHGLVSKERFSDAVQDIAARRDHLTRRRSEAAVELRGLEVSDDGRGSPARLRALVSEALNRVDSSTRRAVVLELVEKIIVSDRLVQIHAKVNDSGPGVAGPMHSANEQGDVQSSHPSATHGICTTSSDLPGGGHGSG